jgi:SAM-dependent methyltransferase
MSGPRARFFDRIAARYDRTFAPSARETEDDLGRLVEGRSGVALDLGCGTGRAFPLLRAHGLRVIGLDASTPMLLEAGRRASAAEVVRVRADLYGRWPLRDQVVDVLVALHSVLAHPPGEPRAAWSAVGLEMRRVLREGALVVIDLPEPAWADAHLRKLGPERYLFGEGDGAVEAVIPEPAAVVAALGLPLALGPGPLGARAVTARS